MFKNLTLLALLSLAKTALADDQVVILSPHRKTIQNEFVPAFTEYYEKTFKTKVKVEWLDQGGTNEGVKFLRTKYAANPKSSGVDIFWGGGTTPYLELKNQNFLETVTLDKNLLAELPITIAGVPMRDASNTWFASAASSFGIFYNKILMAKSPAPKTWADLAKPEFSKKIVLTDPRKSGTANQMNQIILQTSGWDKGFEILTAMAGNAKEFTSSSSDPIKAIVSGAAVVTPAIDFYASPKIADLGADKLGFILPEGKTILDPDPIAMMRGAPNKKAAERFIAWSLYAETQKLWVLAKGQPGGPKIETLGRLAVNKKTYADTNGKRIDPMSPFDMKPTFKLDTEKAAKMRQVFDDYIGATMVDVHKDLKAAWENLIKKGKTSELPKLSKPLITDAEALELAGKWSDNIFRNKKMNEWQDAAKKRYSELSKI